MSTSPSSPAPIWFWPLVLLPPLWSAPGRVAADTKTYLSLDPGGLLAQAPRLWEADTGLGTVTHQTIGYLMPQGPWWWVADRLGVPDWITQRLWWSLLVGLALFGAHRLARAVGSPTRAATVTALAYGFGPYLFAYVSRISAILVPWAVLPWMILTLRAAVRDGSRWRWPARLALLVLVAGTVNATSIAFAVVGAVTWVAAETPSWRSLWPTLWRSAVASAAVSVWWLVALVVQGAEGIDILRFTETYATIRSTALPSELLRGYGYWFSYGGDWLDPWVGATYDLLGQPWYLAVGLGLVLASLLGLTRVIGPARRPAALLVLVGLALSVGEAWTGRWTPWGALFGAVVEAGPGMVLRSTQRAVPVLALGLAVGLGAFASGPAGRASPGRLRVPLVFAALAAQALPWWTGGIATTAITRGDIPGYWTDLADGLGDDVEHRVWETPGSDFASYRWGGTIDPVLVGLTGRPVVARELIPLGTDHAADLVSEVERRGTEHTLDPAAGAPLARIMAVDTVVARNDLEFERYALARPDDVTDRLDGAPDLDRTSTGPMIAPDEHLIDEQTFGGTPGIGEVPAVATWSVADPVPVLTVRSGASMVMHGSAATLVALAEHGLIDGREIVVDGDSHAADPALLTSAWTVLGDSNRSEDRRWYSVGSILGATRAIGESAQHDPSLQSLDVVAPDRATVSDLVGGMAAVTATSYGSPAVLSAEDRPEHAVDGDPFTAWRGAALEATTGLTWTGRLTEPSSPAWVDLIQPVTGERARWITRVRITTSGPDGDWTTEVDLDEASRVPPGRRVPLGGGTVSSITIEVLSDSVGPLPGYGNSAGVGFAEVTLDGVGPSTEWIVLPEDPRPDDATGRTTVVLDRRRIDPSTANRFDPEPRLARRVDLAVPGEFTVSGAWSTSAFAAHPVVRASSPALAGVTEAVWVSEFDPAGDPWFEVDLRDDAAEFAVRVATGPLFSSVGTVTVTDASGVSGGARPDVDGLVRFDTTSFAGGRVRVSLGDIVVGTTVDRFADRRRVLPVGVLDIDGVVHRRDVGPGPLDICRGGLLSVDGVDVPLRLVTDGTFSGCGTVTLGGGDHEVVTGAGHIVGVDLDRVVFDTGAARVDTAVRPLAMSRSDTMVSAEVDVAAGEWLVFAESFAGWRATIDGVDLGDPVLVNGYAMGWPIDTALSGTLRIEWVAQRLVTGGVVAGTVAVVLVALLAVGRRPAPAPIAPPLAARAWSRRRAGLLIALTLGPAVLVAPLVGGLTRRGPRWLLAVPFGAMWMWTSVRQARWDMPIDLRWPSSMGWAQWFVVAVVAGCCWVALTRDE
ncbi:MAG: alpha-(1-_3)-arabinofuranosyltransferase domain-containing protein [Ilumatobacteraceae bacterium]